jgi:uncharacterized protein (DUF2249 family)
MNRDKSDITPATSVADLLRDYPALEETLLQFSPAFAALNNPVLRRTVARVTSLQQAAKVGNVNGVEMVNTLRRKAGLGRIEESFCPGDEEGSLPVTERVPEREVTFTLDVRPIIAAGEHPKEEVLTEAAKLMAGECMELIAPFPPAPLIHLLQKRGFRVTMLAPEEGVVRTFVER